MHIRPARADDLQQIAAIHKRAFPTHYLGRYSARLLARLYRCYLGESVFLVDEENGRLRGFVLGGAEAVLRRCRKRFLVRHVIALLGETALRPRLWPEAPWRLWNAVARRPAENKAAGCAGGAAEAARYSLLSIAVDDSWQRRGIGAALLAAFEAELRSRCSGYWLQVNKENLAAVRFYEKCGFTICSENSKAFAFRKEFADRPPPN